MEQVRREPWRAPMAVSSKAQQHEPRAVVLYPRWWDPRGSCYGWLTAPHPHTVRIRRGPRLKLRSNIRTRRVSRSSRKSTMAARMKRCQSGCS
jgi:hypothetical protein